MSPPHHLRQTISRNGTSATKDLNQNYLERIDQTDALNRGYGDEDDDGHRTGSDQRRRSEGQKNAHTPLNGNDHGQTPRADQKTHVDAHDVAAHGPLPPGLEVRSEEGDEAGGAGQSEEEDEHAVDQGQTEQAQVHPVLQTCIKERDRDAW